MNGITDLLTGLRIEIQVLDHNNLSSEQLGWGVSTALELREGVKSKKVYMI